MDAFDVFSHVRLPLPASQHQLIHFLGASARPLQDAALGDAFYHLEGRPEAGLAGERSRVLKCKVWKEL